MGKNTETEDDDEIKQSPDMLEIDSVIEELGSSCQSVEVWRRRMGDARPQYMEKYELKEFSVDTVKAVYGGGDYHFKFKDARNKFVKSVPFAIDHSARGSKDNPLSATVTTPALSGDSNKDMLALLMAEGRRGQEMMIQMSNQNSTMMMTLMTGIMGVMGKSFESRSQVTVSPSSENSTFEKLLLPVLLKQIENPSKQPTLAEQISNLNEIKKLVEPKDDKDEPEDSMLGKILTAGAPLLAGLMQRGASQQTAQPQSQPGNPEIPQGPAQPPIHPLIVFLRKFSRMVAGYSAQNTPVESLYDIVSPMLDPDSKALLLSILARDTWIQELWGDDPLINQAVAQFPQWFADLRQFFQNPEPPEDTTNAKP